MIYDITVNVNVEDGLTNGSTCIVKFIEYKMEDTDRPSIIWVLFHDSQAGSTTRAKYLKRGFYNANIETTWTPIFDIDRTFIYNFKTFQRIQFPLKASAGKTVHKAQGCTVDEIVVDLSQTKLRKQPHIHYVALSRVRTLQNLHILNLNENALAVDEKVKIEMHRLKSEALLELCYIPLYQVDASKFKVAFSNTRSLHKHFSDVRFEPNVLSADIIGFAETRLQMKDNSSNFTLNGFKLIRHDEKEHASASRPYHGLVLYVKEQFDIQRLKKFRSDTCEFISATVSNDTKGCFQVVCFYKYPKSSVVRFINDIQCQLVPLIESNTKFVILGDFNIDAKNPRSEFVNFMTSVFECEQYMRKPTTDSSTVIDLIFSNCRLVTDVVEAYWTDHKLIYCAIDKV
ncbi:MAG: hypothetical protein KZQ70_14975, partial [gamma proteobacterium symbiont of Lucinoma myriamae]|nr:hypothetical protein [gamma proteobacterium symbiont of Lucinoma myriamae]